MGAFHSACERIAAMMLADNMNKNVNLRMERLPQALKTIVFTNAKAIVKTDITAPIAAFASNWAVTSVLEFAENKENEKLAKEEAAAVNEAEKEKVKQMKDKKNEVDKAYKVFNEKNSNKQTFTTTDDNKDTTGKGNPPANDNEPKTHKVVKGENLLGYCQEIWRYIRLISRGQSKDLQHRTCILEDQVINLPPEAVLQTTAQAATPLPPKVNLENFRNKINNDIALSYADKKILNDFTNHIEKVKASPVIETPEISTGTKIVIGAGSKAKAILSWYEDLCAEYPKLSR